MVFTCAARPVVQGWPMCKTFVRPQLPRRPNGPQRSSLLLATMLGERLDGASDSQARLLTRCRHVILHDSAPQPGWSNCANHEVSPLHTI
jgi:hypothetical protein